MKIVFDARWYGLGRTGMGRYCLELLNNLQELDRDNDYVVLLLPEEYARWKPVNPRFRAERVTCEVYTVAEQLQMPFILARLKPDLVHFPQLNVPILYPGRFVTTVHDTTLLHYKNVRGTGLKKQVYEVKYWAMRLALWVAVKRGQAVLTPTQYVKDDLVRQYHLPDDKVNVTLLAVNEASMTPEPITRLGLGEVPFIFYIGTYYDHKNIGRLLQAFAQTAFCKNGGKLVLGGKPDYFQDRLREQTNHLHIADQVVFTGFLTDGELGSLMLQTKLYVFPSLSEGFGLPGLEAMAQGAPVLAARATCLPEVYGEAAAYCDPLDTADIARQIDGLLADEPRRQQLSRAGRERVKGFSWEHTARETLQVYQRTLKP